MALSKEFEPLVERLIAHIEDAIRVQAAGAVAAMQKALSRDEVGTSQATGTKRAPSLPKRSPASATTTGSLLGRATSGSASASGGVKKRIRRSQAALEAEGTRILAFVRANPGSDAETIKAALGLSQLSWAAPMNRLLESRALIAQGERRRRRYTAAGTTAGTGASSPAKKARSTMNKASVA